MRQKVVVITVVLAVVVSLVESAAVWLSVAGDLCSDNTSATPESSAGGEIITRGLTTQNHLTETP